MIFEKTLFKLGQIIFGKDVYFKIGSSPSSFCSLLKLPFSLKTAPDRLKLEENILVVGTGISALTLLESLKIRGHNNVTVLHSDLFGGKCINVGCMPSEYFQILQESGGNIDLEKIQEFVVKLRGLTFERFNALQYQFVKGRLKSVQDNTALLEDGTTLTFDRLVLATGNYSPEIFQKPSTLTLDEFWGLKRHIKLAIVTDHHIGALSLAEMAKALGHDVTIVFKSKVALGQLPSVQHYVREIQKLGVAILAQQDELADIYDHVINFSSPRPNLPVVNGRELDVFDIDLFTSKIRGTNNIYVTGDAAGFLSAAEAEIHGRFLVESWYNGLPISVNVLEKMPLRFHGRKALAMVGSPWTLATQSKNWKSIDFKQLGWSLPHGEDGKIWFLADRTKRKVDAVHIYHKHANELISITCALLDRPCDDPLWFSCATHPSSAEIFKLVSQDVTQAIYLEVRDEQKSSIFMPSIRELYRSDFFKKYFSNVDLRIGLIDEDPSIYFAVLAALKTIRGGVDSSSTHRILYRDGKSFASDVFSDLSININPASASLTVLAAHKTMTVVLSDALISE